MSLQVKIEREQNNLRALFSEAVARIEKINSDDNNVRIEVGYYADTTAREMIKTQSQPQPMGNNMFIIRKNFSFQMSEINNLDFTKDGLTIEDILKTACYLKMKTLPEFADAIDI